MNQECDIYQMNTDELLSHVKVLEANQDWEQAIEVYLLFSQTQLSESELLVCWQKAMEYARNCSA